MRKLILLFSFFLVLLSCDDGDIITVEFDFDDTFVTCGELVFYKVNEDPAESLSLQITSPVTILEGLIEVDDDGNLISTYVTFPINGTSNQFHYRTYNQNPIDFFCNDVPPSEIIITSDDESTTGVAAITTTLVEDDNDGNELKVMRRKYHLEAFTKANLGLGLSHLALILWW